MRARSTAGSAGEANDDASADRYFARASQYSAGSGFAWRCISRNEADLCSSETSNMRRARASVLRSFPGAHPGLHIIVIDDIETDFGRYSEAIGREYFLAPSGGQIHSLFEVGSKRTAMSPVAVFAFARQ